MTYSDVPRVSLTDYIKCDKFRTILAECRDLPCGVTEIPVTMELKKNSALYAENCMADCFRDEKVVYGFVTSEGKLSGVLDERKLGCRDVEILLNEWDKTSFLMIFRQSDGTEEPIYFVDTADISGLLKNCRNPNID